MFCEAHKPIVGIATICALTPCRGRVRVPCFAMPSGSLKPSQTKNIAFTHRRGRGSLFEGIAKHRCPHASPGAREGAVFCDATRPLKGIAKEKRCPHASPRAREGAVFCDTLRSFEGIANIGALTPRRRARRTHTPRLISQCFTANSHPQGEFAVFYGELTPPG